MRDENRHLGAGAYLVADRCQLNEEALRAADVAALDCLENSDPQLQVVSIARCRPAAVQLIRSHKRYMIVLRISRA